MASREKLNKAYIESAKIFADLSTAKRKKVGCLIIRDNNILSFGYNGTPHGFDNICEDENNITKKEVLHAESNAITKIAKSAQSSVGSSMYLTLSPCYDCAKLIIQSGIKEVFYLEEYRETDGLELLKKANIKVEQISY